jgi:hypothetical protein
MERRLGKLADPYREEGRPKRFGDAAKAFGVAGASLMAIGRRRRGPILLGSTLVLAGAACERWSVFSAGFASAEDPRYTVDSQRTRLARHS